MGHGQRGQGWYGGSGNDQHQQGMSTGTYGSSSGYGSQQGQYGGFMSTMRPMFGRGKAPRGYQRSDERLREMICERLMEDGKLDASDVEVDVKDGRVTLDGCVDSRMAKYQIEDMIEQIGVDDVQNNLRVSRRDEGSSWERGGSQAGSSGGGSSLGMSSRGTSSDRTRGSTTSSGSLAGSSTSYSTTSSGAGAPTSGSSGGAVGSGTSSTGGAKGPGKSGQ
jgi:hypothetical protein